MTVLVGGVGQLYQGDLDIGRRATEQLPRESFGSDVLVEDLSYGAVAVAQRLEELRPEAFVLVGAVERLRPPGAVERRPIAGLELPVEELQLAVGEAVTGYVTLDLVLEVAHALGVLPERTVAIEVEPVLPGPSERLSPEGERGLEEAVELARDEVRRVQATVTT